jgi:hypothetical protein
MSFQPLPPPFGEQDRHLDDLEHWADQYIGQANRASVIVRAVIGFVALVLGVALVSAWLW